MQKLPKLTAQLIRFSIVGALSVIICYAVFVALYAWVGIHYVLAGAIGFLSTILIAYPANRNWTFQSSVTVREGLPKYSLSALLGLGFHSTVQWVSGEFLGVPELWTQLIGLSAAAALNFVIVSRFVFSQRKHEVAQN